MPTPDIEHVVVLMLENRSFDSMLGWLYENQAPAQFLPPGTDPTFRGLQSITLSDFTNTATNPTLSSPPVRGVQGFTVPTVDPGENFDHVVQQFYNTYPVPPGATANMLGYLQDYVKVLASLGVAAADIPGLAPAVMESHTPDQLPVLNQLAQAYAVSDAWYASVPSQTNPNRAFLLCGTSLGLTDNGQLETSPQALELKKLLGMSVGDDRFDAATIFNALDAAGQDWAVFWQTSYLPAKVATLLQYGGEVAKALEGINSVVAEALKAAWTELQPYVDYIQSLCSGQVDSCYTWRLYPQIQTLPNAADKFQSLAQFHQRAQAGQLPAFSYIEPQWTVSQITTPTLSQLPKALVTDFGNDYHPPGNVLVGEQFLKDVYTSLVSNPAAWEKTLLLVTFDEFVGLFDHETEGLQQGLVQPPWGDGTPPALAAHNDFNFDRLGGRAATIVVSPWVQAGTVFRSPTATPFDHTSMIATVLKLLGASGQTATFGARAAAAPTFDGVLTLSQARTDAADLPFMDKVQAIGDPVNWGDQFLLQNPDGRYLTSFAAALKVGEIPGLPSGVMGMCVDLELGALFPTLGEGAAAPMSFVTSAPDTCGQVPDQASAMLISRETGLSAADALGRWTGSHDCYYFTPYSAGAEVANQTWAVQNHSRPGQAICYGDQVILTNASFNEGLSRDTRLLQGGWISTSATPDAWTIEPAPVTLPG